MKTSDFDYALPPELIAQVPPKERGTSRMMVLHRADGAIEHRRVGDIVDYLDPADLMVFNDTRVFAARAFGRWEDTPGRVEVLFVEPSGLRPGAWTALCRSSRPMKPGRAMLLADGEIRATVLERSARDGHVDLALEYDGDFFEILDRTGVPPVPPYIRRGPGDPRVGLDRERYQTVYARETGAVAAPTAGLHFSEELLARIDAKGVGRAFVTLHVGLGTFLPVRVENIEEHKMHEEIYTIPFDVAEKINKAKREGRPILAVGTTSVRTLESASDENGFVKGGSSATSIFMYPGYKFKCVDMMFTNFHTPESTLIMLVSAFAGREHILEAYRKAVEAKYRFFSYGDAMLIK